MRAILCCDFLLPSKGPSFPTVGQRQSPFQVLAAFVQALGRKLDTASTLREKLGPHVETNARARELLDLRN